MDRPNLRDMTLEELEVFIAGLGKETYRARQIMKWLYRFGMTDVAAMSRPEFYSHRPAEVQLVQTHISFIFVAGDDVCKVKKTVDFGFLDFTTPGKRKNYCNEELRLNRRKKWYG